MPRLLLIAALCATVLAPSAGRAASRRTQDAQAIFARGRAHIGGAPLSAVRTVADVNEGGRGWVTTVTSAADGRALFEQGGDFRAGVDSACAWSWDAAGRRRATSDPGTAAVVRGHELHLLAWDPAARWAVAGPTLDTTCRGARALLTTSRDERGAAVSLFHARGDSLPLGFLLPDECARDGSVIQVEWLDWRMEQGRRWFGRAVFHQGGRRYEHRYREIDVVDPEGGWFAPDPSSSARPVLLALHERVLAAHRAGDVERILADEGDEYTVANRGEITHPTLEQRRARMGPYLKRTRFRVYRDLVPPEVRVSPDGRLGWVIVQVEAAGEQSQDGGSLAEVSFVSAWIETYERRDGRWWRVGNVSNFRP